jgi:hypothetical protein
MQSIFVDESGDLGFGCGTKYFILGMVVPRFGKKLNKVVKNFNAHLIRNGWNPSVEIKATNIWHAEKNADIPDTYAYKKTPEIPMRAILTGLAHLEGYIEYAVFRLDTVAAGLQIAPTAILYNYFSWLLLRGPLCYFPAIELFMDRRNRENHHNLKFDGYIESKVGVARGEKGKDPLNLLIHHYHWASPHEVKTPDRPNVEFGVRGIEAADFVCWAIKKKYENGDSAWYSLIESRIQFKRAYFS